MIKLDYNTSYAGLLNFHTKLLFPGIQI